MTNRLVHRIRTLCLCGVVFAKVAVGQSSTPKIVPELISAKTIYIDNETGNPAVLRAAEKKFTEWGRFSLATSVNDGDLKIVFTHRFGMDYLGDVSFIAMDVFAKGSTSPAFRDKNAYKVIWDSQLRTKICISDFRKYLEHKA